MSLGFEVAAGSVQGLWHRNKGVNNQDAFSLYHDEANQLLVAVVCDGCSSAAHSEVGAQLGCQAVTREIVHRYLDLPKMDDPAESIEDLLAFAHLTTCMSLWNIADAARKYGNSKQQEIFDYLLFTVVGCIITSELATFFAIGDGLVAVNGEVTELGPFPNNAPPYIGYSLTPEGIKTFGDEVTTFKVVAQLPTIELQSFMVGCDGVSHLAHAADKLLPGSDTLVGPLAQFWTEDKYFRNPQTLQRKLNVLNSSRNVIDPHSHVFIRQDHGLLSDDTTLIVGRRAS